MRARGELSLVLVTGVFDLLHQEHLNFLKQAQEAGDLLVVGLESDQRVKALKGWRRPIQSENKRRQQLMSLALADWVFILPTNFSQEKVRLELLQCFKPEVLAVSSHSPHLAEKKALLAKVGGEVQIVYKHNPAISTSQLLVE